MPRSPGENPIARAACRAGRGLHFFAGSHRSDSAVATATALLQGLAGIGNLIRREAYVLAYIDGFWIIAWMMAAGIVLLLLLHPPPPNPLTPPRSDL